MQAMNAALLADLKGNALAGLTNAVLSCDLLLKSSLYGFQVLILGMVDTSVGGVVCHLAVVARLAFHLCRLVVLVAFSFIQYLLSCSLCLLSISRLVIG
jgi:hypothetical protein